MYIFLDAITFRYRDAPCPALDRLSLFVRSGEIAAVVGPAGAGKTTLLRYVGKRSDGRGGVFLGSEADESGRKPGLIRGWRFSWGDDAFPPRWRSERWRGVWIRRYAFPNMALDGSSREPPGGWSEEAGNVHFSIHSPDGTVRHVGWKGAGPNNPDRQDLLLVDDLSKKPRFGVAADRRAFIRDLHALHPMPQRRAVIYATRDPVDALEVANRIAVLQSSQIVQHGTPSEVRRTPANSFVARILREDSTVRYSERSVSLATAQRPPRERSHFMSTAKTSKSSPIRIAEVTPGDGYGRIGITLCPGKHDPYGLSGPWARDLDTDLDAIQRWGATAVVTLIEKHTFDLLKVRDLPRKVRDRHMEWSHLPIRDGESPPAQGFEDRWSIAGEALRDRLRLGFDVLIHCRGGLGRAGTIAARLLVELGERPDEAIRRVRGVRHGAIEPGPQEDHVAQCAPRAPFVPSKSRDSIRDRALGAFLGLAVGDAVGTTLEFRPRDARPRLEDMEGGGPFELPPGGWTDDTAMALALADSLTAAEALDARDLMDRFVRWWQDGDYSPVGVCFDIGNTTRAALDRYLQTGDPRAGSTDPRSAGNGSLMRLAPVALRFWDNRPRLAATATEQSRTTHGAEEAVDACRAFAELLADAIAGAPRADVLAPRPFEGAEAIARVMAGSWRGHPRDEIHSSGYVVHTLEAALWSVARTGNFRNAVLLAANLAEDADTVAAVTGQLAGALYGLGGIPRRLARTARLEGSAPGDRTAPAAGCRLRSVVISSWYPSGFGTIKQFPIAQIRPASLEGRSTERPVKWSRNGAGVPWSNSILTNEPTP